MNHSTPMTRVLNTFEQLLLDNSCYLHAQIFTNNPSELFSSLKKLIQFHLKVENHKVSVHPKKAKFVAIECASFGEYVCNFEKQETKQQNLQVLKQSVIVSLSHAFCDGICLAGIIGGQIPKQALPSCLYSAFLQDKVAFPVPAQTMHVVSARSPDNTKLKTTEKETDTPLQMVNQQIELAFCLAIHKLHGLRSKFFTVGTLTNVNLRKQTAVENPLCFVQRVHNGAVYDKSVLVKDCLATQKQNLLRRIEQKEYLTVVQGGEEDGGSADGSFELEMSNLGKVACQCDIAITADSP